MIFTFEERQAISEAIAVYARTAVLEREKNGRLDKVLASVETAIVEAAANRDENAKAAGTRVRNATKKRLAAEPGAAEEQRQILSNVTQRAAERLRELNEEDKPTGAPGLPERVHMAPHLGVWTFTHSLLRVECKAETPPDIGKDDMLYMGSFTYAGPGVLAPYYEHFDKGDAKLPGLTLASVPVVLGRHKYSALHLVTEEDVFSEATAKIVAVGVTLLLDILIEIGIQAGKAAIRGWLMSQRPDGVDEAAWREMVDRVVEELGKVAREGSDNLLGILAEWLAEALGPEVFPQMTSEATIEWLPPAPPIVTGIRVIGSGTVNGRPGAFMSPGLSLAMDVPLRRSGGGDYSHILSFAVSGRGA